MPSSQQFFLQVFCCFCPPLILQLYPSRSLPCLLCSLEIISHNVHSFNLAMNCVQTYFSLKLIELVKKVSNKVSNGSFFFLLLISKSQFCLLKTTYHLWVSPVTNHCVKELPTGEHTLTDTPSPSLGPCCRMRPFRTCCTKVLYGGTG